MYVLVKGTYRQVVLSPYIREGGRGSYPCLPVRVGSFFYGIISSSFIAYDYSYMLRAGKLGSTAVRAGSDEIL